MASNGRHDQTISPLGRYWDAVVQGQPVDPGDLDPALAATVQHLHARDDAHGADPAFAARLLAELEEQMHATDLELTPFSKLPPFRLDATSTPNGWATDWPRRTLRPPGWSALAPFATAVLVVMVLASAYLAGGLTRSGRPNGQPAYLPALMDRATPDPSEPTRETLLDRITDALPTDHALVEVNLWTLQPGPSALTLPAMDGVVMVVPESGELTATQSGAETRLVVRDPFVPANQEVAFRVTGTAAATMVSVTVYPAREGHGYWSTDPLAHSGQPVISTSADALPNGAARLVLERLTLPPGSALPSQDAQPLVWTEVAAGVLELTLEGEHLPFRWKSGTARTFRLGQYLPAIQPGTQMTLRNAGDDPLVLYRLTLIPTAAQSSSTGTPTP